MCKKCQLLAKSKYCTNLYSCSCKLIMNIECRIYIHSLDFPPNIHITKFSQFHNFHKQQGQLLPNVVLALFTSNNLWYEAVKIEIPFMRLHSTQISLSLSLSLSLSYVSRAATSQVNIKTNIVFE